MINEKISLRTWIEAAADQGVPLHTYLLKLSSEELELSEDAILEQMQTMLQVMEESAAFGLTGVSSHSGLTGGAAKKLQEARRSENYKNILDIAEENKDKSFVYVYDNFFNHMQSVSEMMIYNTEDGLTKIETTFDGDTVWLSIDQMAELFQRDKSTISRHIKNIFTEGELKREAVVANFTTTAADGKTYQVDYYNLDVIISVGYRVKSQRGVQFRIWATGILKEYMRKGFALDDERLKNLGGGGYFKELLERIRDIRASEKVFYRQVLEI